MGLFDIYSKEDWRTIMAEEKKIRLEKVLQDMSHSLNHIEDIMADDRELLVKLVKQNNSIVLDTNDKFCAIRKHCMHKGTEYHLPHRHGNILRRLFQNRIKLQYQWY